jgi:hypothetical protein
LHNKRNDRPAERIMALILRYVTNKRMRGGLKLEVEKLGVFGELKNCQQ